jgi:hypothetical protein
LISVFPNVEIALMCSCVHVHNGDQLSRRTFIFKTEAYLSKSASQHNEAAAFELAFTHVLLNL